MVEKVTTYAAAALVLFYCGGNYWQSHWYGKWFILMMMFSTALSFLIARRTSWLYLPLVLSTLISGVFIFAWPYGPYHQANMRGVVGIAIEKNSAYSFICFLAAILTIAFLPSRYRRPVREVFAWVLGLSAVATLVGMVPVGDSWEWYNFSQDGYRRGGFSGNASMNGCLIACLIPYAFAVVKRRSMRMILCGSSLLALISTKAIAPILVLSVVALSYAAATTKTSLQTYIKAGFLIGLALLAGGAGLYYYRPDLIPIDLLTGNGRYRIWAMALTWWKEYANPFWGAGLGTSRVLVPVIQELQKQVGGEYFLWMHSDWVQGFFELGVIGLVSVGLAWLDVAFRAWRNPVYFAAFMGFTAAAAANYPLRLPLHAAAITLTLWLIIQRGGGRYYGKENHQEA